MQNGISQPLITEPVGALNRRSFLFKKSPRDYLGLSFYEN